MEDIKNDENIENKKNNNPEIKVVAGNGSELDVSPVFEHLNVAKPKTKDENPKDKKIIIPKS